MDAQLGLILLATLVISAITVGLRIADGATWPSALLLGGAAAGGTVTVLIVLF
jgi:hypothetical protein